MKAAVFYGPQDPVLKIEDVEKPTFDPGEVLIRVKACGICHSDVSRVLGIIPTAFTPIILGHEPAGIVDDVGKDVTEFKKGDRVAVWAAITCGMCPFCKSGNEVQCTNFGVAGGTHPTFNGAFAEYYKAPADNVFNLPKNMSFEEGAIAMDAAATPFHAVRRADIKLGDTVAIYGVGGLGMNAVQFVKLSGGRVIAVDIQGYKLERARQMGAKDVINSAKEDPVKKIKDLTGGNGADRAMDFTGIPKVCEQVVRSVRNGGRAIIVGHSVQPFQIMPTRLMVEEVEVTGSHYSLRREIPILLDLVSKGTVKLKPLITHVIPLDEINRGMRMLNKGIDNPIRIIVTP